MNLTLHLTKSCNLRCHYCYDAPHVGGDMSFETARSAIDLAVADTHQKSPGDSIGISFFGGEPLLRKDLILEVIRYCQEIITSKGQRFHFSMTTNGTLLDESFLTHPMTCSIYIAISHDGIKEAHDIYRTDIHGHGTYERLEPIIERLLQHKPNTPVMMAVNPDTVGYYFESIMYLYQKGFRNLIPSVNFSADWHDRHFTVLKKEYRRLADWYLQATLAEEKFYFSPFESAIASHIHPGSCRAERCELGKKNISVAPNGRLYPCVQFVGDGTDLKFSLGHVRTGVDEPARDRLLAMSFSEKDGCETCAIRERCRHYCGCINRATTGNINRVSPILCAHERLLLPIADKLAAKLYKKRSPMFIQKHYNELYPLISFVEDRIREGR